MIATDHAPHSNEENLKAEKVLNRIETAFSVLYTKLV